MRNDNPFKDMTDEEIQSYASYMTKKLLADPKILIPNLEKVKLVQQIYNYAIELLEECNAEYTIDISREPITPDAVSIDIITDNLSVANKYYSVYKNVINAIDSISQYSRVDGKMSIMLEIFDVFHVVREKVDNKADFLME